MVRAGPEDKHLVRAGMEEGGPRYPAHPQDDRCMCCCFHPPAACGRRSSRPLRASRKADSLRRLQDLLLRTCHSAGMAAVGLTEPHSRATPSPLLAPQDRGGRGHEAGRVLCKYRYLSFWHVLAHFIDQLISD